MTDNGGFGIYAPKILMPAEGTDLEKWATIACDQYTSDPGYWQMAEELIGDAPSTLDLQMPEAWLGEAGKGHEGHEAAIPHKMKEYLENGTLREIPEGFVFIKRETSSGTRRGLLALADMDRFDYRPGSKALIRASEETVESRLPVRVEIRKTAPLEMPHAMLLFRDPKDMLMGSLEVLTRNRRPLYDFPLMLGGGRIRGWLLQTIRDWNVVADIFNILLAQAEDGMLFAVGDGNHSLAAAKLCREQEKARGISSYKRFALVELVNLYDPALPVYHATEVAPGLQGLYYNVKKAPKAPAILAAASREYEVKRSSSRFSYLCKGPRDTYNITRILLPARPASASVNGEPCPFEWDQDSRTVFLRFPNSPDGAKVELAW